MNQSLTLESRINANFESLNVAYTGGGKMSSATKGTEGNRTVSGPASLLAILHQLENAFQSMTNRFAAYTQYFN